MNELDPIIAQGVRATVRTLTAGVSFLGGRLAIDVFHNGFDNLAKRIRGRTIDTIGEIPALGRFTRHLQEIQDRDIE